MRCLLLLLLFLACHIVLPSANVVESAAAQLAADAKTAKAVAVGRYWSSHTNASRQHSQHLRVSWWQSPVILREVQRRVSGDPNTSFAQFFRQEIVQVITQYTNENSPTRLTCLCRTNLLSRMHACNLNEYSVAATRNPSTELCRWEVGTASSSCSWSAWAWCTRCSAPTSQSSGQSERLTSLVLGTESYINSQ